MGGFVGVEVAAEGGVFDLKVVVALLQFLDRGDHRRDERGVFQGEGSSAPLWVTSSEKTVSTSCAMRPMSDTPVFFHVNATGRSAAIASSASAVSSGSMSFFKLLSDDRVMVPFK